MRVAVVGGGIAGLAAAWELTSGPEPAEVTVFEPGALGGRVQTETFCDHPVDTGADAFIARVPEGLQLARELGIEDELVAPAARKALIWVGGRLRPLPDGLVLGAPARLGPLLASGILSPAGVLRAGLDLVLPATRWPEDPTVAAVVGRRFGAQVAQRLVDPLVGGIHAGRTEDLSAESTAPQLARAARSHRSLLLGLRALPTPAEGPLFLAPRAGMGRLVTRLVEALRERNVRFEPLAATSIRAGGTRTGAEPVGDAETGHGPGAIGDAETGHGAGASGDAETGHGPGASGVNPFSGENGGGVVVEPFGAFDAVVVATPARVAAELLNDAAPATARELRGIRTASVVLTTLAYRRRDVAGPDGVSGWLVARARGGS